MKTITARFDFPDGRTAQAVASFATLPGESPVQWIGHTAPLASAYRPPYSRLDWPADAGTFRDAMTAIAVQTGAKVIITDEGDWKLFEE